MYLYFIYNQYSYIVGMTPLMIVLFQTFPVIENIY